MPEGKMPPNWPVDLLPDGDGHSLYLVDPSDLPGAAERRAERERTRIESRRIHRSRLLDSLADAGLIDAEGSAEVVLAALFIHRDVETGEPCSCSCHPHLPDGDLHDYGRSCSCTRTKEERLYWWNEWRQEMDAYWDSPEGMAETDACEREESELRQWLVEDGGIVVTEFGGWAPEQWRGTVDGHSFYFRERHDRWRIELDLRPTGRFYKVFKGGAFNNPSSFEQEEVLEGEVIAEGTPASPDYGTTPRERAEFLARTIRGHIARRDCRVHIEELYDLERLFGRQIDWCPGCGKRI